MLQGLQCFHDCRTGTTHDAVLFDGNDAAVCVRQFFYKLQIDRFYKAHVGNRGIEFFSCLQGGSEHGAKCQNRDFLTGSYESAFANFNRNQGGFYGRAGSAATRVAHGHRVVLGVSRAQGLTALGLVATRSSGSDPRGRIALMTVSFSVGQILGPAFAGYVYEATGSLATPLLAAVAMSTSSLIVIANSLRLYGAAR